MSDVLGIIKRFMNGQLLSCIGKSKSAGWLSVVHGCAFYATYRDWRNVQMPGRIGTG